MNKKDKKNIQELIKKPELYLGMLTLIVAGFFIVKATYKPVMKVITTKSASVTPTLAPTIVPIKAIITKQVITPKMEAKKSIKKVTKFADTGAVSIIAKEGDSFWKLTEKVCGNGAVAESTKQENGYGEESLQPGDTIIVSCN